MHNTHHPVATSNYPHENPRESLSGNGPSSRKSWQKGLLAVARTLAGVAHSVTRRNSVNAPVTFGSTIAEGTFASSGIAQAPLLFFLSDSSTHRQGDPNKSSAANFRAEVLCAKPRRHVSTKASTLPGHPSLVEMAQKHSCLPSNRSRLSCSELREQKRNIWLPFPVCAGCLEDCVCYWRV